MIIEASETALPHMFLRGFRAPVGQKVVHVAGDPANPEDDTTTFEEVGTFVARSLVSFAGAPLSPGDVAIEDTVYGGAPTDGPFLYEADIAVWKPVPDVVVVADLARDGLPFGHVAIDRGAGFGPSVNLNFGWLPRGKAPRLALAGDATTSDPWRLEKFKADQFKLPEGYDNLFLNGGPLASQQGFAADTRLRFTDTTAPLPDVVTLVTIPPAPVLSVTQDGAPLDPPLTLVPLVDTVVMNQVDQSFLLLWRATFPWDARYEAATLEVR